MEGEWKVARSPSEELAFTNKVVFHPDDVPAIEAQDEEGGEEKETETRLAVRYVKVTTANDVDAERVRTDQVLTVGTSTKVARGEIALNQIQRRWLNVTVGDTLTVSSHVFPGDSHYLERVTVRIEHLAKGAGAQRAKLNTDKMSADVSSTQRYLALSIGQPLMFKSGGHDSLLKLTVMSLAAADPSVLTGDSRPSEPPRATDELNCGILMANSNVVFEAVDRDILLTGSHLAAAASRSSIISTDLDFVKMGIGGLDEEAAILFRRAFASRVFPPKVIKKLGVRHVKGILLYGPPGCGKTLMARQIGQMLNAREPKLVNGPEILNKYVGESEANIRKLFKDAEDEQQHAGADSGLHMIIFDEIDAICKRRGSRSDNTGVHDNVVTQLLSKMDGVDELDNILIIGMTNRKDLIDDALMRPGRFEVQMEIGLPNEFGRQQILEIHTRLTRENGMLGDDVDLPLLAHKSVNFSGAELAGLVRAATSTAMNRVIKKSNEDDSSVTVNPEEANNIKVMQDDFLYALEKDIKPMFGVSIDQLKHFKQHGIVEWGRSFSDTAANCRLMIKRMMESQGDDSIDNFSSMLLYGEEGVGTSALAVNLAMEAGFTFIKVCSTLFLSGTTELAKVNAIHEVFEDAYRAHQSCVIVDCIENLIEYTSLGNRYSSHLLQEVRIRVAHPPPEGHKLLVIGTTSNLKLINKLKVRFRTRRELQPLTKPEHVETVLRERNLLPPEDIAEICCQAGERPFRVGVKHLILTAGEARIKPTKDERVSTFLDLLYAPPPSDEDDYE